MSDWRAAQVSAAQRRALAQEAAQQCREHPEIVAKLGARLARAAYVAALIDEVRCGHVSPYNDFMECLCEEDD